MSIRPTNVLETFSGGKSWILIFTMFLTGKVDRLVNDAGLQTRRRHLKVIVLPVPQHESSTA